MDLKLKSSSDGWKIFIPEFAGNRELPKDKQMTVEVHWLDNGEQKRYGRMVKPKVKGKTLTSNAEAIDRLMFVQNVRNITNLSFDGTPVTDPGTLFSKAPAELVNEINKAVTEYGEIDEEDEKN